MTSVGPFVTNGQGPGGQLQLSANQKQPQMVVKGQGPGGQIQLSTQQRHPQNGLGVGGGGDQRGPLQPGYVPSGSGGVVLSGPRGMGGGGGRGQQQQQQQEMMARPPAVPGVPPGLEYLTQIDQLLVHQQVEVFEVLTGVETCNRYIVKNTLGQQIYFCGEESGLFMRTCCGSQRGFVMHIVDNFGQEVIRVNRKFKCFAGFNCFACCRCCSMEIEVEAPVGQTIGYVRQLPTCLAPTFIIADSQGQTVLVLDGPSCACSCCSADQDFRILAPEVGTEVGLISKQWSGFLKEYFTDADNYGITFPMDLDVRIKATLLSSVFLIDFMFFENNQGQSN